MDGRTDERMDEISSENTFTVGGLQPQQPVDVSLQNHMKEQNWKIYGYGQECLDKQVDGRSIPGELHP